MVGFSQSFISILVFMTILSACEVSEDVKSIAADAVKPLIDPCDGIDERVAAAEAAMLDADRAVENGSIANAQKKYNDALNDMMAVGLACIGKRQEAEKNIQKEKDEILAAKALLENLLDERDREAEALSQKYGARLDEIDAELKRLENELIRCEGSSCKELENLQTRLSAEKNFILSWTEDFKKETADLQHMLQVTNQNVAAALAKLDSRLATMLEALANDCRAKEAELKALADAAEAELNAAKLALKNAEEELNAALAQKEICDEEDPLPSGGSGSSEDDDVFDEDFPCQAEWDALQAAKAKLSSTSIKDINRAVAEYKAADAALKVCQSDYPLTDCEKDYEVILSKMKDGAFSLTSPFIQKCFLDGQGPSRW